MLETVDDGWRGRFRAFGVGAEVRLREASPAVAREALRVVSEECWRVDAAFSLEHPDSLVCGANAGAGDWVDTGPEFDRLLAFADTCFRLSGGRFDISTAVLGHGPMSNEDAAERWRQVGWQRIKRQPGRLLLAPGMVIDFGALAREYALDRALFLARLVHDADLLVRLGPDAAAVSRAQPWRLVLDGAEGDGDSPTELLNGAIACRRSPSAASDDPCFGHVVDAVSGCLITAAPCSVTVLAGQCIQAGMLATLAMIKGAEAERFLSGQDVRFWCQREDALVS